MLDGELAVAAWQRAEAYISLCKHRRTAGIGAMGHRLVDVP